MGNKDAYAIQYQNEHCKPVIKFLLFILQIQLKLLHDNAPLQGLGVLLLVTSKLHNL